jgi:hypothetical protein
MNMLITSIQAKTKAQEYKNEFQSNPKLTQHAKVKCVVKFM